MSVLGHMTNDLSGSLVLSRCSRRVKVCGVRNRSDCKVSGPHGLTDSCVTAHTQPGENSFLNQV